MKYSRTKLIGTGDHTRSLNDYLKTLERQVYEAQQQLLEKKFPLTTANLKAFIGQRKNDYGQNARTYF